MAYALRFIAGRFKGGEFPLKPNREIVIGRGSEFDMVLDEDMVSRRHAKIATFHGQIVLQDLKSTNGTFVNGERTSVARLKVGDKVLVGTSVMELIRTDEASASGERKPRTAPRTQSRPMPTMTSPTVAGPPPPGVPSIMETQQAPRVTIDRSEGMSGRISPTDVTVTDLIELFHQNRRTGVLVLTDPEEVEGRVFFRDGAVYFATIARPNRKQEAPIAPLKCFYRMLTWERAQFRMDALNPAPTFDHEIEGDTRNLVLEGVRQFDELKLYIQHLPDREARLVLTRPLRNKLSALSAEALDTLQVVLNHAETGKVLDYSEASDLETCQDILYLIQNEYLTTE